LRDSTSLFLLILVEQNLVVVQAIAYPHHFQRFNADHLVLRSTFITDDDVAFFNFVHINVKIILAFRAARHGSLLSFDDIRIAE